MGGCELECEVEWEMDWSILRRNGYMELDSYVEETVPCSRDVIRTSEQVQSYYLRAMTGMHACPMHRVLVNLCCRLRRREPCPFIGIVRVNQKLSYECDCLVMRKTTVRALTVSLSRREPREGLLQS